MKMDTSDREGIVIRLRWVWNDKREWIPPEFFIMQWGVGLKGIEYSARGR